MIPILGPRLMFAIGWSLIIPALILFRFITESTNYWRFTFPGMILYIAGVGWVYIAANFIVISSAPKSDQGAVAGVFNVAVQVGGAVFGLAVLTAVHDGVIKGHHGDASSAALAGYRAVYYGCMIISAIGLLLSLVFIKPPVKALAPLVAPSVPLGDAQVQEIVGEGEGAGAGAGVPEGEDVEEDADEVDEKLADNGEGEIARMSLSDPPVPVPSLARIKL